MSKAKDAESSSSFIVMDSMNGHGAITVQQTDGHATYHIVDYADAKTRERLASLTEGSKIRMEVERAGVRANVWKATKLLAGSANAAPIGA
jgi:hypothetical protein